MLRAEKKNVRKDGGSGYRIESVQAAEAGGKGVGQSGYSTVRLLQGGGAGQLLYLL